MHVAVIFSHIGPYHLARLRATNQACQAAGWQLTVIQSIGQTSEHPWGDLPALKGVSFKTLLPETCSRSDAHPDSLAAVAALTPCLDAVKPDVLAIPGWGFSLSRKALDWCQRHRMPAILMSESKQNDEPRTWWKEQLKSYLFIRKYAAAIVGGSAHKDYLVQLGFDRDHIFYGYDAVDNDYFTQSAAIAQNQPAITRAQHPQIPTQAYFLSVTRLIPRKNMLRLVKAFAFYVNKVGKQQAWPLVICGKGEDLETIQQFIAENELDRLVLFPGFLTYQQIGSWYGLAGAFVHPALVEQWGLVVNEACAAGLPVACSETVGACSSLVKDRQNGFVFDPNSTEEISQALLNIHLTSKNVRKEMGQVSQKLVAQHSPKQFAAGLFKAINAALPQIDRVNDKQLVSKTN